MVLEWVEGLNGILLSIDYYLRRWWSPFTCPLETGRVDASCILGWGENPHGGVSAIGPIHQINRSAVSETGCPKGARGPPQPWHSPSAAWPAAEHTASLQLSSAPCLLITEPTGQTAHANVQQSLQTKPKLWKEMKEILSHAVSRAAWRTSLPWVTAGHAQLPLPGLWVTGVQGTFTTSLFASDQGAESLPSIWHAAQKKCNEGVSEILQCQWKWQHGSHLYEVPRVVKFIESESAPVNARSVGDRGEMGSLCLMGT